MYYIEMLNNFILAKLPSIYNNKTVLNEYITDNRLNSIIQNNIGIEFSEDNYQRKTHGFVCEMSHNKMLLSKFNKKEGCYKIKLENNKHGWGRIKAQDHATLSVLHRPTRHSLCHGTYIDIDIKSCCQSIYLNIVKNNGIENQFPRLKEYVDNRDELLIKYQTKFNQKRDIIKKLFTMIGFGGSHMKWFKTFNIPYEYDEFIAELNKEYYKLSDIIYEANQNIIADILKVEPDRFIRKKTPTEIINSKKRTTVAIFYQSCERYCQEAVISYLCNNKNFILKNIVPCQDGFMILKDNMYKDLCADCEMVIKNKFNMDLIFVVKEFDERYEIPTLITDKEQQRLLKEAQRIATENEKLQKKKLIEEQLLFKERQKQDKQKHEQERLTTNEMIKQLKETLIQEEIKKVEDNLSIADKRIQEFEKNHIKIINKGVYLIESPEKIIVKTKHQLVDSYEHLESIKVGDTSCDFIKYWTADNPDIRSKDDMEIYPDASKCPKNIYNMWKPFAGETIICDEIPLNSKIPYHEIIPFFRKHILILCDNDANVAEYMELWIAQMIQYPALKSNCPILISKEGAGKGTFLELLQRMLGHSKYFESTNPARDVWGNFNSIMHETFLVNLNELSKSDTTDSLGKIKGLITDPAMYINIKNVPAFPITSYHRWIITTNKEDPMPTSKDDRRFWIVRSSDELITDKEYHIKSHSYLEDDNVIKIMFNYFKQLKGADKFGKLQKPVTEYQENLQDANVSVPEMWLKQYIIKHMDETSIEKLGSETFDDFQAWKTKSNIKFEMNATKLGCNLSNLRLKGLQKGRHTKKGDTKIFNIQLLLEEFKIGEIIETHLTEEQLKQQQQEIDPDY